MSNRTRAIVFWAAIPLLVASNSSLAAAGEDPLEIRGMIEALVHSEFDSVNDIEIPTLSRFTPNASSGDPDTIRIDVSPTGPLAAIASESESQHRKTDAC